jgi:hypothetical protein
MRRILIDRASTRSRLKQGGNRRRAELALESFLEDSALANDLIDLDVQPLRQAHDHDFVVLIQRRARSSHDGPALEERFPENGAVAPILVLAITTN